MSATAEGNRALSKWLAEVLKVQCHDGTVVLPNGWDAAVEFDGECVSAYTYGEDDKVVYHARVRLVPETD